MLCSSISRSICNLLFILWIKSSHFLINFNRESFIFLPELRGERKYSSILAQTCLHRFLIYDFAFGWTEACQQVQKLFDRQGVCANSPDVSSNFLQKNAVIKANAKCCKKPGKRTRWRRKSSSFRFELSEERP